MIIVSCRFLQRVACGLLAYVFFAGLASVAPALAVGSFPTLVATDLGEIQGFNNTDATVAWLGVPFAQPPVGELRWKAPQPPEPWEGVRDATTPCEACLQKGLDPSQDLESYFSLYQAYEDPPATGVFGSEDCLYLNIFRPDNEERDLPVYIFIHGGAFSGGSAYAYDGSSLARKHNIIVVSIQYRLGVLGWLPLPALRHGDSELDDSGDFGTLDVVAALRWVTENIDAFGGDPHNVTIGGESAGAYNVMSMVISPLAKGLFQRAVSESCAIPLIPMKDGEILANNAVNTILAKDGYKRSDWEGWSKEEQENYLRSKDGGNLIETCVDGNILTYPVISPGVLPGGFAEVIRSGDYNKVPIILGTNQYEEKLFMSMKGPMGMETFGLPWSGLMDVLVGERASIDEVLPTAFDKKLFEVTAKYGTLAWRAQNVDERARALAENQDDVYAYQFNWGGPEPFNYILGGCHGLELPFFLGIEYSGKGGYPSTGTPGARDLTDTITSYLANFIRNGNPNGEALPQWQAWDNGNGGPKTIQLDADDQKALVAMDTKEVIIQNVRAELRKEIRTWPLAKQIRYGFVPYLFPLITMQLQPEQVIFDMGPLGQRAWNTGGVLRALVFQLYGMF